MKCQRECAFQSEAWLYWGFWRQEQRELEVLQIMLYFSWSEVCIETGSNQLLTTSYVEALTLTSWCGSWMRFLVHARMLACMLLPLWHGCQQCQGFETDGCYQTEAILQVPEPRDGDSVWSSTPEVHQEPFPQIRCAVLVWAHANPASCHYTMGRHFKCVKMGQNCPSFLQAHRAHLAPVAQDAMKISLAAKV